MLQLAVSGVPVIGDLEDDEFTLALAWNCLGPHCSAHALRRADDHAQHAGPSRVTMAFGRPPGWPS